MKFGNLLKKELGELITKQAIISMVFMLALFIFLGQILGGAMEESMNTSSITVCCRDSSDFTKELLAKVTSDGTTEINYVDVQSDDYPAELERLGIKNVIIIPENFGKSILEDKQPADIIYASTLSTSGLSASMSTVSSSDMVAFIQNAATNEIMLKTYGMSDEEIARVKEPAQLIEYTISGGKTARISAANLQGLMMSQSMIAPFVIFFLLLMAAQMIMTAISTEKIDKTLETLLSTPVSRMTVLTAKMTAAVISALLNAVVMTVGMGFYMGGMMGGLTDELNSIVDSAAESGTGALTAVQAMSELGLTITPAMILLFGLQLFFTVAIGLAISLILGAMATDVKSVQTLTMPIMIVVMIPFFISMFLDISSMSPVFKTIMFLIPFTHSYTALTNLMNGDMIVYWAGLAYQIVFFCVCMYLAVKMFTTDKLFTMSVASDGRKKGGLLSKKTETK